MSHKQVMISSTSLDLPEHRKQVVEACLRQGFHPIAMEHLPARDATPVAVDAEMIDKADLYIGIYAWRYGEVPPGHDISYTELEFNRAVARGIPILVFTIHKDHPLTIDMVETDATAQQKLAAFKQRVCTGRIRAEFKSPEDLRANVISSLSQANLRQPNPNAYHYVSDIPAPPETYIAHPYTLLQTHRLVGRQAELNLLTDWVAKPSAAVYHARILNFVAIGGMGKSALTWQWFNEIAPQEMKPLAGRMWWSFYESDATFENFVTRALAYVTRRPLPEVEAIPAPDRATQLLAALDREPFLIVLDGLERLLIAYARMDAAHLSDDEYDRQTANIVAHASGLPASAAQSFTGEHRLRKAADPRVSAFLRKLTTVRASRVLVSTRLYPADLQTVMGEPMRNCFAHFLPGLAEDDALELWRAFGAKGSRDNLLSVFSRIENHPLLIQALAGEVARYRHAPGDFDAWQQAHPDFNPFRDLPLVQVKSHVLECALRGLDERARQALHTIAAFRMPANYDTLTELFIGAAKPCANEPELDAVLTELEDRGLVGWDKRANRYDIHPIVRGVVWSGLGERARRKIFSKLHLYFEILPRPDPSSIKSVGDLIPAIELYNSLIGLKRFHEAYDVFSYRLMRETNRFNAWKLQIDLLSPLVECTNDGLPRLDDAQDLLGALTNLGRAFSKIGQLHSALYYVCCAQSLSISSPRLVGRDGSLILEMSHTLLSAGRLFEAHRAALKAEHKLMMSYNCMEGAAILALALAARGQDYDIESRLASADAYMFELDEDILLWASAQSHLWFKRFDSVLNVIIGFFYTFDKTPNHQSNFIRYERLQGEAALGLHDFVDADKRLHYALTHARQVNFVEEELPALIALAELRRQQGQPDAARELLDDVWDAAERGPYPLFHADALNVLAQLERDAGNVPAAIAAATEAYRLAWCDGPPYAYHWGLVAAREHLHALGAPEPDLPPFDPTKFEPMPEVEIDPEDEFHVGNVDED